jgi:protein arginine N-methyltransferase 1
MSFNNTRHQATKIRFNDEEEEEESSNLDDSIVATEKSIAIDDVAMQDPDVSFVDGCDDDKTSADYYFDSYSHFGNTTLLGLLIFFILPSFVFCPPPPSSLELDSW